MDNTYDCIIECFNNNKSKYSIKSKIEIFKCFKDSDNIKLVFPSKEYFINFDFDTIEEDIYILFNLPSLNINNDKKFNLKLNNLVEKYKRKLSYKIKWNLKIDKKKITIKSLIINKNNNPNIYILFEKYAIPADK